MSEIDTGALAAVRSSLMTLSLMFTTLFQEGRVDRTEFQI
jgi:hypothetical protein